MPCIDSPPAGQPTATSAPVVVDPSEQPTIAGVNIEPTATDTVIDTPIDQPNVIVSEVPAGADDQTTIAAED